MDLFGRKARKELEAVKAQFEAAVGIAKRELVTLRTQLELERTAATNQLHEKELELVRLEERLKPFQQSGSTKRLYKTEEEEEAEFAYEQGHIDYDEYEKILRKAGFENASVGLAPEVSDIVY